MGEQHPRDRQAAMGSAEAAAAHQYVNQQVGAFQLLLKLLRLPFWLPFVLASGCIERRKIRAFLMEQAPGQTITSTLIRDLAIRWAERNPKRYPHGRYDRKFGRLLVRFESAARILQNRRGYK